MDKNFLVLIVEDDFRIANITSEFVSQFNGFSVVGTAKTGEEALEYLKASNPIPDLILLDVYIPDVKGLDLFWSIRKMYRHIDIIMVTATKEVATIEETLRGGIFDYIVKPVDFSRLESTFKRYSEQRNLFASKKNMEQEEIDVLTRLHESESRGVANLSQDKPLPKGIDYITLDKVRDIVLSTNLAGITAVEVSQKIGASRSTARRYLEYMTSMKELEAKLIYGEVGRPERRYVCKQNEQN